MKLYEESTEVRCPNCDALCERRSGAHTCAVCGAEFSARVAGGRVTYDLRRTILPIEVDWEDDMAPTMRSAN